MMWQGGLVGCVVGFVFGYLAAAVGTPFWLVLLASVVNGLAIAAGSERVPPLEK